MNKKAITILLLLATLFVRHVYTRGVTSSNHAPLIHSQTKSLSTTSYQNTLADVVRVVDGDTIVVSIGGSEEKVRLLGINTPETVDPRRPVECFGKEASNKTKELLYRKRVSLTADKTQDDRDKYGRLLRYVYTEDGTFVNKELILEGYAYEYTYHLPYMYQKDFKAAERRAQNEKRGLWAGGVCGENNV